MFTNSIRWRLQMWLGILLLGMLVTFGVTSWRLEKDERIRRLDDELAKRSAALGVGVRTGGGPPPRGPGGGPPPDGRRGPPPDFDAGNDRPRGPGGPGNDGPGGPGGPGGPPPDMVRSDVPEERNGMLPIPPNMPADRVPDDVKALFPEKGVAGFYYSVWVGNDLKQQRSLLAPDTIPMPSPDGRNTQTQFRERDGMREAYHFTERGECVLAGRPLHSDLAAIRTFALRLSLTGLGVLVIGIGGGWWITSRSIRSIEHISTSARRISEGNLSERIPLGKPGNELGQLASVLNDTFARLEDSFAQQKRFTADASHELRTPLTVLITETQAALSRERSSDDYREALTGNLETARQMKHLAEALLELARLDGGVEDPPGIDYDLTQVVSNVTTKLKPLADARATRISMNLDHAPVNGSPERLGLVIKNPVENAIHHGRPAGSITVKTWQEEDRVCLTVSDDGPGIKAEDMPHLFERFYRADKSRTGSKGRYGLGLAICKGLVEAEKGTITVESAPGGGASFRITLPKA